MTDPETPPSLTAQMQALVVNWRAEADRTRPSYINGRRCDLRVNSERAVATFRKCADDLAALIVQVERLEQRNAALEEKLKSIHSRRYRRAYKEAVTNQVKRAKRAALRGSDR